MEYEACHPTMKVLVIDDEPDIRLLARVGLTASGFTVVVADGGEQGLRLAREAQPDVILLDVMMPAMDGYATLAALRADPATASIPVLFLTAKAQVEARAAGEPRLGVLNKPFVPRELAKRVREFLDGL
jgi:two-component system, OmpR family, alkaline phosphatase synthesis response regulator PhoP